MLKNLNKEQKKIKKFFLLIEKHLRIGDLYEFKWN